MENSKEIDDHRKYELQKALAVFWEVRLAMCDYKELSEFLLAEGITPEDIAYIKTLTPHVEFEERRIRNDKREKRVISR